MSAFSAINLNELPAPEVIESLDYESILQQLKDQLKAVSNNPLVVDLESEPLTKLLEVCAFRELVLRQRINDASRSVLLAHAVGADLDNLAALYSVQRQITEPGDPNAIPPVETLYESDERLRRRVQLSLEGHSTAGPVGSYVFHSLSADSHVKDVEVISPQPGRVQVTILSSEESGVASDTLLNTVAQRLNHEDVRPLTDLVTVQAADVQSYQVQAELTLYSGPDTEVVRLQAIQAVERYVLESHRLGHDVSISGLFAALHQPGVQNVTIISPAADIVCQPTQAAWCSSMDITVGVTNE